MKTNPNDPINPVIVDGHGDSGLTKREYFALMILNGLEASNTETQYMAPMKPKESVNHAIMMADLLISALAKINSLDGVGE